MRKTLCVLGAGNMGLAITDGILNSGVLSPSDITLVRRNTDKLSSYKEKGCNISSDVVAAARDADAVMLAVKPQMMQDLFANIAPVCEGKLVISIAAGIKIETIRKALPGTFVVRTMPNTPLTVGEGVTELCRAEDVSDEDYSFAKSLFAGAGLTFDCREEQINALTALTSSAVAYFAAIEDAMVGWAMENGLGDYDRQALCDLVSKTALGTSKLMLDTKMEPTALIKAVASPKGTTEQALRVFSEKDLDGTFKSAMTACLDRAEELAKN